MVSGGFWWSWSGVGAVLGWYWVLLGGFMWYPSTIEDDNSEICCNVGDMKIFVPI